MRLTAIGAALRGLGKVLSSPGLVIWLWVFNVAWALPVAVVLESSIRESIGASRVDEKLASGFDMGWFGAYRSDAEGLESSFTPTVIGSGAFLNNVESWFNGDLFHLPRSIFMIGIGYVLMWSLFQGGILHRYGEGGGLFRLGEFLAHGGTFFFRFVRLALIASVLYYLVYRFSSWLFQRIELATEDVTREESILAYVIAGSVLIVSLLSFVNMVFDYAKIATFRENRRSMLLASLKGLGFALANLGRTVTLYYALGIVGLAMLALYHLIAPGAEQSTPMGILFAFAVGQTYLIAKLVLRLTYYASELALFDAER